MTVWEAFKTGYSLGLGVLAVAATGLILWGALDWLQELIRISRNLKSEDRLGGGDDRKH